MVLPPVLLPRVQGALPPLPLLPYPPPLPSSLTLIPYPHPLPSSLPRVQGARTEPYPYPYPYPSPYLSPSHSPECKVPEKSGVMIIAEVFGVYFIYIVGVWRIAIRNGLAKNQDDFEPQVRV